MSATPTTIQASNRMLEFTASASGVQTPHSSRDSLPEHESPEHLQLALSHELGRQERHLAWRLEVAYALGDMDQVEDDVNMAFITRFINHQLLQTTTLHVGGASSILAGISNKRC